MIKWFLFDNKMNREKFYVQGNIGTILKIKWKANNKGDV